MLSTFLFKLRLTNPELSLSSINKGWMLYCPPCLQPFILGFNLHSSTSICDFRPCQFQSVAKMPPKKRQSTKRGSMKRKQQKGHNDQPAKKAKTQKAPPVQKHAIQWVLPRRDPYRTAGIVQPDYDATTAGTFAVPLFGHYWDRLSNTQITRLHQAPIYSPAQKIKRGRDTRQSDRAHKLNNSNHALHLFFQRIQHNIRENNVNFEDVFEVDAFGDVAENSALLASNSYVGEAYAIDKLNSDVQVTV